MLKVNQYDLKLKIGTIVKELVRYFITGIEVIRRALALVLGLTFLLDACNQIPLVVVFFILIPTPPLPSSVGTRGVVTPGPACVLKDRPVNFLDIPNQTQSIACAARIFVALVAQPTTTLVCIVIPIPTHALEVSRAPSLPAILPTPLIVNVVHPAVCQVSPVSIVFRLRITVEQSVLLVNSEMLKQLMEPVSPVQRDSTPALQLW